MVLTLCPCACVRACGRALAVGCLIGPAVLRAACVILCETDDSARDGGGEAQVIVLRGRESNVLD